MINTILLNQSLKNTIKISHTDNCLFVECYTSLLHVNIRDFFKGFIAAHEYLLQNDLSISSKIFTNFSKFSVSGYDNNTIIRVLEKVFKTNFSYTEIEGPPL